MNEKNPPLNKEGCHWGGSISRSKAQSLSITVDVGTDKLQLKLRAIAKHTEALANELDAIDNAWMCECGSNEYTETYADSVLTDNQCNGCGKHFSFPVKEDDDLPTHLEGSD